MALPLLAGALMAGGLIGSLSQKTPKYNYAGLDEAKRLIEKQYGDVETYFKEAGTAFETQFSRHYGQTMQDAVSQVASRGIYESPVSERSLGRTRTALGETYATAQSQLAGQKMQAIGAIDQQKVAYLQNLANAQYNQQLAKQQKKSSMFSMVGGLGGSLLGL